MKVLGWVVTVGTVVVVAGLFSGWVFALLWNWFMPVLGLPEITLIQGWGIGLVVSLLTYRYHDYQEVERTTKEKVLRAIGTSFGIPLATLIAGIIYHWLMVQNILMVHPG